jgi:hypothetical protein
MTGAIRVAVLIDCDNISWRLGAAVLAEAASKGTLGVKRGYGDWSSQALSGWKKQMPLLAIQPMQQPAYVAGKNATDSALIIDAMDLLYSGNVDTFFLVSSDSDFTRLAMRLRESGRRVFGIGAQTTPVSFQNACDRFTFTEVLVQPADAPVSTVIQDATPTPAAPVEAMLDATAVPPIEAVLVPAVRAMERDDGWAALSSVGAYIVNNHPTFDSRNYGSPRLGLLVRRLDFVEVKQVVSADGSEHPYVRVKPTTPPSSLTRRG